MAVLRDFFVRCNVGQTLADDAAQRRNGTVTVVAAKRLAIVIPKLELCQIAMQVRLAAMLIDALHAAFEDAEIAFDRVAVDGGQLIIDVWTAAVIGRAVRRKVLGDAAIDVALVGHNDRFKRPGCPDNPEFTCRG